MYGYYSIRVFPFGDLRVNACLQLVVAFRSLPRPSSALSAKASTVCPYSLDLFCTCCISTAGPSLTILRMYHQCLFSTFVSSLAKKLSFSICSVGNCFYLLQKNFSIIHCVVFKEPCFLIPFRAGGDKQNRTADPLLARQVLSQLSYTPI